MSYVSKIRLGQNNHHPCYLLCLSIFLIKATHDMITMLKKIDVCEMKTLNI